MDSIPAPAQTYLICRSATRLCALPIEHVVETMRPQATTSLPDMPAFMVGLSIIRGASTPVIHIASLLGEASGVPVTRFVTVRLGPRVVALAVGAVLGIRLLSAQVLADVPLLLRSVDNQNIAAIGVLDAELMVVLEHTRMVPDTVWTTLNQHAKLV